LKELVSSESISEAILNLDFSEVKLDPKIVHSGAKILNFEADLREVLELAGLDADRIFEDEIKFGLVANALVETKGCFHPPEIRAWVKFSLTGSGRGNKFLFSELKSILEEKCAQIEGVKKMSELVLKYDFSDDQKKSAFRNTHDSNQQSSSNRNDSHSHNDSRKLTRVLLLPIVI
jgi:hypothetical protein